MGRRASRRHCALAERFLFCHLSLGPRGAALTPTFRYRQRVDSSYTARSGATIEIGAAVRSRCDKLLSAHRIYAAPQRVDFETWRHTSLGCTSFGPHWRRALAYIAL